MADPNKTSVQREFGLTTLAVNNRTAVLVLTILLFISGVLAYQSMPSEAFPEIVTPEIYVGTAYPGNSPLDIEKLVTRPLEKEINGITGIDEITSTSVQGYSTIRVKFDFKVSPSDALRKVKDKVDVAKSDPDFPTDLPADPNVFELNFAELVPIMNINLSGEFSSDQLKAYGEYLEERIEALPEISKVDIRGVDDKEVRVSLDVLQMEKLNLSYGDIAQAIQSENVSISGGDLLVDRYRRNVRVVGEISDPKELGNIIVKAENGMVVYLRDLATIDFAEKEKVSYAREFTQPVVMLDVTKRAGENLIVASEKIDQILADAKADFFPENLEISKTNDQSDQTRNQLSELENSIIFGVLLVVLVLMFFLGLRNALFVGIAIPLSMLLSFLVLNSLNVTLNTMVLFSLVLALGMLVDNGIVVVENIHRLMSEGKSAYDASKEGVGEVAIPIIASTATTVAAFVPLALWPGIFGQFMKYLPLTLIVVLSSSLFVALVINPVLTAIYMKVEEAIPTRSKQNKRALLFLGIGILIDLVCWLQGWSYYLGNLFIFAALSIVLYVYAAEPAIRRFQSNFLPKLEDVYERTLRWALTGKMPRKLFLGSFGLLFSAFFLMAIIPPKVEFFPVNEPNLVNVYIELPIGTDIEETNALTKELETTVIKTIEKYEVVEPGGPSNFMVESVIAQVGEGTSDPNAGPSMAQTPNKAKITVALVEFKYRRGVKSSLVLEEIRNNLRAYPGVQITVDKNRDGPPAGAPISLEIKGQDYEAMMAEAENLRTMLKESGIRGIEELKLDVEQGKPELIIDIDRAKARLLGISTGQIGDALRTSLFGREVSTYKDEKDDYPINIRLQDRYRYDQESLLNQRITFRDQASGKIKQVPISAVATARKTSTFSTVNRKDLDRVITITSNVLGGYNPTEVVGKIKEHLQNHELPKGMELRFTGEQEQQAEELGFLSSALLIAVFLIFMIMVMQFNSASSPFIIMTSVVLSLIGVLYGLIIFRMDFIIIMTMIGIISLAGVVVNNAIVLIDYTNLLYQRKRLELGLNENERLPIEAVYESIVMAGKTRLRPVLLTAITTILGLVPLAIGLNIDFFSLLGEFNPNIYIGGDNVIFWGPMSWTIIFGLTFATFLTLVLVPVMFYLLSKLKLRLGMKATS